MKNRIIAIIAAMLIAASSAALTACSGGDSSSAAKTESTASATEAKQEAGALTADDYAFSYNGAKVELDTDADAAVEALGEYTDVSSQLTCHAQEGDDKTYTYDGFVLNTYPKDGKDTVLEVIVSKEGIPTAKGVEVGDTADKVKETYGDGFKEIGLYLAYDAEDGKSLRFLIEDDKVAEIDYYFNV